ncbi:enoyl-CoA hydratase [Bradyrhizobium sp.]|uniref:enoyl-CoA hydratase n=1 Tax=Bradyrhizobium sp. TaxID=376 RepID=UPI0039E3C89D
MSEGRIEVARDGAIGWVTFSNPKKYNAVSFEMWQSLPMLMARLVDDPEVRVIVLRGAGEKAFISGADISQFESRRSATADLAAYDDAAKSANQAILSCPKPTVAMIQGYCLGGGVGVALCCDLRYAAVNARFSVPAARLGLGYAYDGIKQLVALVGPSFAKEIFFSARQFTAEEACSMGLVNRIFPSDELSSSVTELALEMAGNAPMTIHAAKLAVDLAVTEVGDIETVDRAVAACFASDDYREGRRAFVEKRLPRFEGK